MSVVVTVEDFKDLLLDYGEHAYPRETTPARTAWRKLVDHDSAMRARVAKLEAALESAESYIADVTIGPGDRDVMLAEIRAAIAEAEVMT